MNIKTPGSGKSNLMDAISFVLGVQSAQLRGTALKDLVYSFDLVGARLTVCP
jgi:structural maintenance of chromosome 1